METYEIAQKEFDEYVELYTSYTGLELADKLRNEAGALDRIEDYYEDLREMLLNKANAVENDSINQLHDNIESMLTSNGFSFDVNYATTGSIYYTFWKSNDESDEPKIFKLRVANHQQLYDADYSIDPYGMTFEQVAKSIKSL